MDELRAKLESREKEIADVESKDIVYKEFDGKGFKEISKQERDVKEMKAKETIKQIELEEKQKNREIQNIIESASRRPAFNPFLAEIEGLHNQDSEDEIFS